MLLDVFFADLMLLLFHILEVNGGVRSFVVGQGCAGVDVVILFLWFSSTLF